MIRLKSGLPFFILGIIFIMCSVCSLGWGGNGGDDFIEHRTNRHLELERRRLWAPIKPTGAIGTPNSISKALTQGVGGIRTRTRTPIPGTGAVTQTLGSDSGSWWDSDSDSGSDSGSWDWGGSSRLRQLGFGRLETRVVRILADPIRDHGRRTVMEFTAIFFCLGVMLLLIGVIVVVSPKKKPTNAATFQPPTFQRPARLPVVQPVIPVQCPSPKAAPAAPAAAAKTPDLNWIKVGDRISVSTPRRPEP